MNRSLVKDGYNQAAEAYLRERDQFKNNRFLEKLTQLIRPQATVLDLGCGSGSPIDRYLVDRGFRVIGLDISERQIELAQSLVPEATFAVRDISALRAGEFSVDAIVSFYAIFHLPRESHEGLFRTLKTFLSPGGFILVTMGASEWEGLETDFCGAPMWWSHYGPQENAALIHRSGFEIVHDEIDDSGGEKHQIVLARKPTAADQP